MDNDTKPMSPHAQVLSAALLAKIVKADADASRGDTDAVFSALSEAEPLLVELRQLAAGGGS